MSRVDGRRARQAFLAAQASLAIAVPVFTPGKAFNVAKAVARTRIK
jgi:hypothetical protein